MDYNLSKYCDKSGRPSFNPFLFLVSCKHKTYKMSTYLRDDRIPIAKTYWGCIYLDDTGGFGSGVSRVTGQDLPMVEHALWESLTTSIGTEISSETERFIYRQVCFNYEHGRASHLHFFEYVTTSAIQHTVNTTNSNLGTLQSTQQKN